MATKSTKTENKKSAEKVAKETENTKALDIQAEEKEKVGGEKEQTPRKTRGKKKASAYTWDGHPLTANESRFIDEYLRTGIGRDAYIKAFPESNPKNAHQNAYRLLNRDYITSEIQHRTAEARTSSIASAQEIMQYFTDVMQGKIKDAFGLEASLAERTKAAVELAKRQIDIPQKLANTEAPEIKITLDFAKPDNLKTVAEVLGTTNADIESVIDEVNKEESDE